MTIVLGLTGSIGMGKSTTARLFAEKGCAVWDADAAVHRMYARGGAAVQPIGRLFEDAVVNGEVSRKVLRKHIAASATFLRKVEDIVHPLVERDRQNFLRDTKSEIIVLDIPLLFETGRDDSVDAVVCVSVPPEIQRDRVLARDTITEADFEAILTKQMPDEEKRRRSDYVIITDTLEHARQQVQDVIEDVKRKRSDA